jgi:hypothetical protein
MKVCLPFSCSCSLSFSGQFISMWHFLPQLKHLTLLISFFGFGFAPESLSSFYVFFMTKVLASPDCDGPVVFNHEGANSYISLKVACCITDPMVMPFKINFLNLAYLSRKKAWLNWAHPTPCSHGPDRLPTQYQIIPYM